jgi:hypothetical protein
VVSAKLKDWSMKDTWLTFDCGLVCSNKKDGKAQSKGMMKEFISMVFCGTLQWRCHLVANLSLLTARGCITMMVMVITRSDIGPCASKHVVFSTVLK